MGERGMGKAGLGSPKRRTEQQGTERGGRWGLRGSVEVGGKEGRGDAKVACCHLLWCSCDDDLAACFASFGSHVDDVVCCLDDIEVVFYDDYGVAFVDEAFDDGQEGAYVFEVEACGGLVEDVEGLAGVFLCQFGGEFDSLAFSSAECAGWLAEADVAETYFL